MLYFKNIKKYINNAINPYVKGKYELRTTD